MPQYPASKNSSNPLSDAYEDAESSITHGPRPADVKPLSMQQAIMRCHADGLLPSRANVFRLMGITTQNQFPVELSVVSRPGN